jgi:hypothetical protein
METWTWSLFWPLASQRGSLLNFQYAPCSHGQPYRYLTTPDFPDITGTYSEQLSYLKNYSCNMSDLIWVKDIIFFLYSVLTIYFTILHRLSTFQYIFYCFSYFFSN